MAEFIHELPCLPVRVKEGAHNSCLFTHQRYEFQERLFGAPFLKKLRHFWLGTEEWGSKFSEKVRALAFDVGKNNICFVDSFSPDERIKV